MVTIIRHEGVLETCVLVQKPGVVQSPSQCSNRVARHAGTDTTVTLALPGRYRDILSVPYVTYSKYSMAWPSVGAWNML